MKEWSAYPAHHNDAVLLLKQYLSCGVLSQKPILILPFAALAKLDEGLVPWPRNSLTEKELQEFRKTASKVNAHPWNLKRAAGYLRIGLSASKENRRPMRAPPHTLGPSHHRQNRKHAKIFLS